MRMRRVKSIDGAGAQPRDVGAEAVEFAMVLPVLATLLFAVISLGTVFCHYQMLIAATEAGCRYFASARGISWPNGTITGPWAGTSSEVTNAASGLTGTVTVAVTVNGQTCTDSTTPSCATALSNNIGTPAAVTATYPCSIVVYGINFAPGCTLSQTVTEIIE